MHGDRLIVRKARTKIFALEHPGETVTSAKADYFIAGEFVEPFAVVADLSFFFVEDFVNLGEISLGIGVDLLARERGTSFGLPGWVSNHRGEIADEEDGGVAEVLKMFQFAKDDGVAQVKIGGRGVDA